MQSTSQFRQLPREIRITGECLRSIATWAITFAILFGTLKLMAIAWFLGHGVDPFIDFPRWRIPLLWASDLLTAWPLGLMLGLLDRLRRLKRPLAAPVRAVMGVMLFTVVVVCAVNLKIVEVYRAVFDRYLMRRVGDPAVMLDSIADGVDINFFCALLTGVLAFWFLPRRLSARLARARTPAVVFFALLTVVMSAPMALALPLLRDRDTFGLKHNVLTALAMPLRETIQYGRPEDTAQQIGAKYPGGSGLLRPLSEPAPGAQVLRGHPELRDSGKGMNVVLLLLESVSAKHVSARTTPRITELMRHSLSFTRHHTTAVNTFDAHYSLFRSTPMRGDAFVMRQAHGGVARDPALMEVFARAGYAVGMFHGSFLHYLDTLWVWESEAKSYIRDARDVIAARGPGWSWGANDSDLVDEALAWVDGTNDSPFFLVINPSASHHPYYSAVPAPFPGKQCLPRYESGLHAVDDAVKRLLDGLSSRNLAERTIIVGVSDHGELIDTRADRCGHGMVLGDDELRVPFFIHHPSLTTAGAVEDLATDHWDVAPTITALTSLATPREWLGRNLVADSVASRASFVGLNYRRHMGVIADGYMAELDLGTDRIDWKRVAPSDVPASPPSAALQASYERRLRELDERVVLYHASFATRRRPSN